MTPNNENKHTKDRGSGLTFCMQNVRPDPLHSETGYTTEAGLRLRLWLSTLIE